MAVKTISKCSKCGYPLAAEYQGQTVSCPNCGTINEAISGVEIPTWLFASSIGLAIGIIAGPALIASTETGARWLERRAREKLAK